MTWWLGLLFAVGFAALVTPALTAERWLATLAGATVEAGQPAPITLRVPPIAGLSTDAGRLGHGGLVIARGDIASADDARIAAAVEAALPRGVLPYVALFVLACVLAAIFSHHMSRSTRGRLLRVQVVSLVSIAALAVVVKLVLLATPVSVLAVPVAALALVPTLALDRNVGIATGILGALVVALLGPFDVAVAIIFLVQAAVAGLVAAEQPRNRWRAALSAGAITTLFTAATSLLLSYLTSGALPVLGDPLHSVWFAAALGPAIATLIAVPLVPLYRMLVGEITRGRLIELEDLSHPLLRQIAERSPGTWQHSLMMANMAEIAANAIGADGRLVRVGAYYHDLGKSLQPKYFIENLEPGETSPHDQLPPEVSCDAIFAHVTEGIAAARRAGLHERIIDFMHMHHGDGVLEYFWNKVNEQGNPRGMTIEQFRYPGHPPQSRETAILAIVDAVEAASRTLKKPDPAAIASLVQRIVYGKLHLGQLDESGLSMRDLRCIVDSLRETIRAANHGRIEYPWQKAPQDASASPASAEISTSPRLDSLDRSQVRRRSTVQPAVSAPQAASTAAERAEHTTNEVALAATADLRGDARARDAGELAIIETAPVSQPANEVTVPADRVAPENLAPSRERIANAPVAPAPAPRAELLIVDDDNQDEGEDAISPHDAITAPDFEALETVDVETVEDVDHPDDPDEPVTGQHPGAAPADDAAPVAAPPRKWSEDLAARVDRWLEHDEWGHETPVVAPSPAQLRSLLGTPDPTRQVPQHEIEALQRRIAEDEDALEDSEPEFLSRRTPPMPTAEVDPEDIEAAIEVAPPARRASTAVGIAKPKKPE